MLGGPVLSVFSGRLLFRWGRLCPAGTLPHDAAAPPAWVLPLKHTHARESLRRHAAHALVACTRSHVQKSWTTGTRGTLPITTPEIQSL